MVYTFVVLCVVLLLFISTAIFCSIKVIKIDYQQKIGLLWLDLLALLLDQFQNHRGLTSGFLNGSEELQPQISALHKNIDKTFSHIQKTDNWILSNDRWCSIKDHWSRIKSGFAKKEADANILEHNMLIQNTLYLIDDMAQSHQLLLLSFNGIPLHLLWRDLLYTTEYIGQARAIGTGIAAQGSCDSISRIRLNFLCQQISDKCEIIWKALYFNDNEKEPVFNFIYCLKNNVLKEKKTSISSVDYFNTASNAINSLRSHYSLLLKKQSDALSKK